ncbi:Cloroperoxidase, partial [Rhodotorula sp. JG-1b]
VTGALGNLVNGLATGGASNVDASNRFPDANHPFQAPGPTDQRGVCPGLNALANHGYLPRNGIVTAQQVISATKQVFNMGEDLSGLLCFIAVTYGGNLQTQTFSIGGEDDRTYSGSGIGSKSVSRQFGLDAHSRCEGDSSPTRNDFYLDNGDNHSQQPDRFRRLLALAKQNSGNFDTPTLNALFGQNSQLSIQNNPKYYANGPTLVVILAAYPIIPEFFSNGTYGAGGKATLQNIAPLMGFKINDDGTICAVPEQIPDNWYRRSTPYGIANVVANAPGTLAAGNTLPSPLSSIIASGNTNEIGCQLYQLLSSQSPATLGVPLVDGVSTLLTGLQNQLLG